MLHMCGVRATGRPRRTSIPSVSSTRPHLPPLSSPRPPSPPPPPQRRSDAKDFARAMYNLLVLRGFATFLDYEFREELTDLSE